MAQARGAVVLHDRANVLGARCAASGPGCALRGPASRGPREGGATHGHEHARSAERPSDDALAARLVPAEPRKRPPGYSRAELAALTPAAREAKLLESFSPSNTNLQMVGHVGAMLVLDVLAGHPIPAVAVALHQQIHSPDFSTQMPKPGFHEEIRSDLAALVKKHPDMEKAILAAKKGKK